MLKQRSIVMMLVLTFVTCGIYNIFWLYFARVEMRGYLEDSAINPGLEVLAAILCFPYSFYLFYKMSKDVCRMQNKAGIAVVNDNTAINMILLFFGLGLISEFIMQSEMNDILLHGKNHAVEG